jgi:hypothetical protein
MEHAQEAAAPDAIDCASCAEPVSRALTTRCAWCERTVCARCLRTYGHFQLVCQDCHLGDW